VLQLGQSLLTLALSQEVLTSGFGARNFDQRSLGIIFTIQKIVQLQDRSKGLLGTFPLHSLSRSNSLRISRNISYGDGSSASGNSDPLRILPYYLTNVSSLLR